MHSRHSTAEVSVIVAMCVTCRNSLLCITQMSSVEQTEVFLECMLELLVLRMLLPTHLNVVRLSHVHVPIVNVQCLVDLAKLFCHVIILSHTQRRTGHED